VRDAVFLSLGLSSALFERDPASEALRARRPVRLAGCSRLADSPRRCHPPPHRTFAALSAAPRCAGAGSRPWGRPSARCGRQGRTRGASSGLLSPPPSSAAARCAPPASPRPPPRPPGAKRLPLAARAAACPRRRPRARASRAAADRAPGGAGRCGVLRRPLGVSPGAEGPEAGPALPATRPRPPSAPSEQACERRRGAQTTAGVATRRARSRGG
jgi:hypothetical protein